MRALTIVALALSALCGCAVRVPEGRFACTTAAECPTGWSCVSGFCVSEASETDAGVDAARDAATPDAEPIDSGTEDATGIDAAITDAGPEDAPSDDRDASSPDAGGCPSIGSSASVTSLTTFSSTGEDDVPALAASADGAELYLPLQFSGSDLIVGAMTYATAGGMDGLAVRMSTGGAILGATLYFGPASGAPYEAVPLGSELVTTGHFATSLTFGGHAPVGSTRQSSFLYRESQMPLLFSSMSGSVSAEALVVGADRICIGGTITGDVSFGGSTLMPRMADGFVACFTHGLAPMYSLWFGGAGLEDRIEDLAIGPDGSVYLVGRFAASAGTMFGIRTVTSSGMMDGFVARLTPGGALDWFQNISTADGTRAESATAVAVDGDAVYVGGFLGAGAITGLGTAPSFTSTVAYWARFAADTGAVAWSGFEDTSSGDTVYSIATDGCGHVYVGGGRDSTATFTPTNIIPYIVALDSGGVERWRMVASTGRGSIRGIAARPDGRVFAVGPYTGTLTIDGMATPAARGASDVFFAQITQ